MTIDKDSLKWLEENLDSIEYGDIGLIFHIRNGTIDWIDKFFKATTKKKVDKCEKDSII